MAAESEIATGEHTGRLYIIISVVHLSMAPGALHRCTGLGGIKSFLLASFTFAKRCAKVYTGGSTPFPPPPSAPEQKHIRSGTPSTQTDVAVPRAADRGRCGEAVPGQAAASPSPAAGEVPGAAAGPGQVSGGPRFPS
jgi:hypothetical protein